MPPSIRVNGLSKAYRTGQWLPSLRSEIQNRLLRSNPSHDNIHWALRHVSFEVGAGETLGIIGPNGAGKTTILKILSGVTRPTSGSVTVNGRFSSLIELGAGFHPDLTGRENIYLNATILGMRRSEIKDRFDQIVEFAGIGSYLDTPVKRYSSGMYARLGFAVAAHVNPQILLVDEVLAVGDYAFQQKCYARMNEMRAEGAALILVSHNLDVVRRVCDRGLVLYRGEAVFQGSASDAVSAYSDTIRSAARTNKSGLPSEDGLAQRAMTFEAEIKQVRLLDERRQATNSFASGEEAVIQVDVVFHCPVQHPIFALTIRTPDGRLVYDTTTQWAKIETPTFEANDRCRVEYVLHMPLLEGLYELGVDVAPAHLAHYFDRVERAVGFSITRFEGAQGLVNLDAQVSFLTYEG